MSSGQLIVVAAAIFVAATVQMVAGFGFALLAMPIATLAVPVERAVVIVSLLSVTSTIWQAVQLRADVDRTLVRRLTISSYLGMPLGLVVLNVVDDKPLRIVLGVSVLIATALLTRRISLAHFGGGLDYPAGFLSGVLNTSLGTNGPPLVFALQARHLSPQRFRATIVWVFALGNAFSMLLFLVDGKVTRDGLHAAAIAAPAWLVGLAIGVRLRPHFAGERFRVLVLSLMFVAGTTAIVFALT